MFFFVFLKSMHIALRSLHAFVTPSETNFINGMVGHEMNVEFCDPKTKWLDALCETGVLFEQVR
jgi:hypothetical protein